MLSQEKKVGDDDNGEDSLEDPLFHALFSSFANEKLSFYERKRQKKAGFHRRFSSSFEDQVSK
jgi:hypothetical protein